MILPVIRCLQKENEELPTKSSESSYFFSLTFLLDLVPRLEIHLPGFYYGLGSLHMVVLFTCCGGKYGYNLIK